MASKAHIDRLISDYNAIERQIYDLKQEKKARAADIQVAILEHWKLVPGETVVRAYGTIGEKTKPGDEVLVATAEANVYSALARPEVSVRYRTRSGWSKSVHRLYRGWNSGTSQPWLHLWEEQPEPRS